MTLFSIPDTWAWSTLGEIADVVGGVTKDGKKQADPTLPLVPYLRVANVQRGYLDLSKIAHIRVPESTHEKLRLQWGDVLLNEGGDRDKLGRGWVWQNQIPDCIHQNHVFRARLLKGSLHPKLLALFTNECGREWFDRNATQSVNLASISLSRIKQLPVPIPPSAEQERILATLEDHLSRIEAATSGTKLAGRRLDLLARSVLNAAIAGRLAPQYSDIDVDEELRPTAVSRTKLIGKAKIPARPADTADYKPPTHWRVVSLDALCYASGYGTSTKCDYAAAGAPVLRIPNIRRGEIDMQDMKNAIDPFIDLSSMYIEPGDILFVRTNGSRDLIGRMAAVKEPAEVAFASYLIRFRLVPGGVPADWIRVVVNSPLWRQYLEGKAASSAGQYNLNSKILAELPIPVPPQKELVQIMAEVDRQESLMAAAADAVRSTEIRGRALRRSLLEEAFAGRLVAQDPADETADQLLSRLRQDQVSSRTVRSTAGGSARSTRPKAPPAHSNTPARISAEIEKGTLW